MKFNIALYKNDQETYEKEFTVDLSTKPNIGDTILLDDHDEFKVFKVTIKGSYQEIPETTDDKQYLTEISVIMSEPENA
jgi:hypothetical protein